MKDPLKIFGRAIGDAIAEALFLPPKRRRPRVSPAEVFDFIGGIAAESARRDAARRSTPRAPAAEPPAGPAPETVSPREQAARFIAAHCGLTPEEVLADPKKAWRVAAQALHPDHGGDAALFRQAQDAYRALTRRPR